MGRRYSGLDGLRGIAALIVVFHHVLLVSPAFLEGYLGRADLEPWVAILYHSPLHVLHAGREAVFVFFILSGFVLALPAMQGGGFSWAAYYPKRIIRLYVPVVASVGFTLLTIVLVPRISGSDFSLWFNMHAVSVEPAAVLKEAILLLGAGAYNSPLWSLRWEVLFSLLLPAYLWAGMMLKRGWVLGLGAMLVLSLIGMAVGEEHLAYLPMFGIGVLLAVALPDLEGSFGRRSWLGPATFAAGAVGLTLTWVVPTLPGQHVIALASCALIVLAFACWRQASVFGNLPPLKWLGSRSFSLYLVHEPVVVSLATIFGTSNPGWVLLIALPVALAVAEGFFRLVESGSHRLANRVGDAVDERLSDRVPMS